MTCMPRFHDIWPLFVKLFDDQLFFLNERKPWIADSWEIVTTPESDASSNAPVFFRPCMIYHTEGTSKTRETRISNIAIFYDVIITMPEHIFH